jgi:hypothetical protein
MPKECRFGAGSVCAGWDAGWWLVSGGAGFCCFGEAFDRIYTGMENIFKTGWWLRGDGRGLVGDDVGENDAHRNDTGVFQNENHWAIKTFGLPGRSV